MSHSGLGPSAINKTNNSTNKNKEITKTSNRNIKFSFKVGGDS